MIRDYNKYVIIKTKDIDKYLNDSECTELADILNKIYKCRVQDGKKSLQAVVIENDWPEYETVWKLVEERVDNEDSST